MIELTFPDGFEDYDDDYGECESCHRETTIILVIGKHEIYICVSCLNALSNVILRKIEEGQ